MNRLPAVVAALGLVASSLVAAVPLAHAEAAGAYNDAACRPSARHPYPVVLLHGTSSSTKDFDVLGPLLASEGYCVFAENYGADPTGTLKGNGIVRVPEAVAEVSGQIAEVLQTTGAEQVDLVGHSQGAMIAEAYAKQNPARVHAEVLLAPPTHGTTLGGLVASRTATPGLRASNDRLLARSCPSCVDMENDSDYVRSLNEGGITVAGVHYAVLATRQDSTVTPAGTASFIQEPGVANAFVQDVFPGTFLMHGRMPRDARVHEWVSDVLQAWSPAASEVR